MKYLVFSLILLTVHWISNELNVEFIFLEKGHKKSSLHIVDHDGLVLNISLCS